MNVVQKVVYETLYMAWLTGLADSVSGRRSTEADIVRSFVREKLAELHEDGNIRPGPSRGGAACG